MVVQGKVAIKRARPNPDELKQTNPVWDEREVSFMMRVKHPRLVTFLGAGEITDDRSRGCKVLFMVQARLMPFGNAMDESALGSITAEFLQEYMSGGSIDKRLWGTSPSSLSWYHRLAWACDIAEAMDFIHQQARETSKLSTLC